MSPRTLVAGGLIALLVGAAGTATGVGLSRSYRVALARDTGVGAVPAFAPDAEVFGLTVGRSSYADVQAFAAEHGLTCEDASMATIMARAHAAHAAAAPDAMTSASAKRARGKPRAPDPQVRFACRGVDAHALDASMPEVVGRVLFVFDRADAPLGLVSLQYTQRAPERAVADVHASIGWMVHRLGPPRRATGRVPEARVGAPLGLAELAPVAREWRYGGLTGRVSAINYGPRGTVVSQELGARAGAPSAPLAWLRRSSSAFASN